MSLSLVLPYIRAKMSTLNYVEHFDAFDGENIPSTILDKSYRVTVETMSAGKSRALDYEWTMPVEIEVYFKGFTRPIVAIDEAIMEVEKIMDTMLDVSDRFSQSGIREMYPTQLSFERFTGDNDAVIRAKFRIEAIVNLLNDRICI